MASVTVLDEYDPQRDRLKLVATDEPPNTTIDETALRLQILSVLHGLSSILAARLILLLAVLIGGGLGGVATWRGDTGAIVAATLYDVFVVIPMVLLAVRKS